MQRHSLLSDFQKYFGLVEGGINLKSSLSNLPLDKMASLKSSLLKIQKAGRVYFLGNGGSFDNSRWMSSMLRRCGFFAKVPGFSDDYFSYMYESSYADIYAKALATENLTENDIVIGISGSGNSQNVINGLKFAEEAGASIFAFGGRDGGKLKSIISESSFLVVENANMEAIEDLHNLMFFTIYKSIIKDVPMLESHKLMLIAYDGFLTEKNLKLLEEMAYGMIHSACHDGHVYILGLSLGANHFRADMNRGPSNALPIRGVSAPEVFNLNSAEATANDDGPDFILADGLVKFKSNIHDFAILCDTGNHHQLFEYCEEILADTGTRYYSIGLEGGVDISTFSQDESDLPIMMIAHSSGEVLRSFLATQFTQREITLEQNFVGQNKKFGMKQTIQLEEEMRTSGDLEPDEVITFCYGKVFAVKPIEGTVYKRCYY